MDGNLDAAIPPRSVGRLSFSEGREPMAPTELEPEDAEGTARCFSDFSASSCLFTCFRSDVVQRRIPDLGLASGENECRRVAT